MNILENVKPKLLSNVSNVDQSHYVLKPRAENVRIKENKQVRKLKSIIGKNYGDVILKRSLDAKDGRNVREEDDSTDEVNTVSNSKREIGERGLRQNLTELDDGQSSYYDSTKLVDGERAMPNKLLVPTSKPSRETVGKVVVEVTKLENAPEDVIKLGVKSDNQNSNEESREFVDEDTIEVKNCSAFNEEEKNYLYSVGFKSCVVDSVLLLKLACLDNDLIQHLILILNGDQQVIETELNRENGKTVTNTASEQSHEIYVLLLNRLAKHKDKLADTFFNLLLQLNDKSKFTVTNLRGMVNKVNKQNKTKVKIYKETFSPLVMTENQISKNMIKFTKDLENKKWKRKKSASRKTSKVLKEMTYSQMEIKKRNRGPSRRKKVFKVPRKAVEFLTKLEDGQEMSRDDVTIIGDFRKFLSKQGTSGVKALGKLLSINICSVLSRVCAQTCEGQLEDNNLQNSTIERTLVAHPLVWEGMKEEELTTIDDLRNFLLDQGSSGVKALTKLLSINICNVLSRVCAQTSTSLNSEPAWKQ